MLCTLTDIKTRLGIDVVDETSDDLLTAIIAGFTAFAERYCGRGLILPAEAVTESYTGLAEFIGLRRYPVSEITSVKEAFDWDFANAAALVADVDYRLVGNGEKGLLYRAYGRWLSVPDAIQVVYRGGYVAAGEEAEEGETAMPADLREAAIQQCTFIYKRKDDIGLSAISFQGGSANMFSALDLLPLVRQTLDGYRRVCL